ncbi:MAG TPA: hypothetical protein VMD47_09910 [Candidatus Acidoferrales bacterium]|nr:hypothetical protein [Candidatus Acidoferrales bacterium]
MRSFAFAFLAAAIFVSACSGNQQTYTPSSASQQQSTVSFLVIVPTATTSARRRDVTVPSNSQSVTITLNTVNGSSYSGTPTTANLSSSASGCTATSAQLSCIVNVTAPSGTLVFTVAAYSGTNGGGTLLASGSVSVTTTGGQTVSAPLTLGGTIAKIAISISALTELGISGSFPVTVQAEDSNGNTILGTYTSPVTLTDSDTSGSTTIATSGGDSPPASELLSSGDTAMLVYNGGAMTPAATIGATVSGLSSSDVTTASFLPEQTNPTVNGNEVTYSTSAQWGYNDDSTPATPGPVETGAYGFAYQTGQSFDGTNSAILIDGSYYTWTPAGATMVLSYLGWNEGSDGEETCATPYQSEFVIPVPSSGWNVYSGTGPCAYSYSYYYGANDEETDAATYNADGSYTYTESYNYTYCCTNDYGTESYTLTSQGNAQFVSNEPSESVAYGFSAPANADSPTLSVTYVDATGTFPPSGTPAPYSTTVPNPWLSIGASGVTPPLQSDVYTNKGSITSLPAGCNVSTSILGSSPTLTEIDETQANADPLERDWLYYTETAQHYYLAGVGQVCFSYSWAGYYYDNGTYAYVGGSDQYWDECTDIETDSLSTTSLTAAIKKRDAVTGGVPYSVILDAAARARMHQIDQTHLAKMRARLAKKGVKQPGPPPQ